MITPVFSKGMLKPFLYEHFVRKNLHRLLSVHYVLFINLFILKLVTENTIYVFINSVSCLENMFPRCLWADYKTPTE